MSFSSTFRTRRSSALPAKPTRPLRTILLERTGHPDLITSRLLMSAADALEGNAALDALFRHQLTDLLATRLLAAHTGSPAAFQPTMGGLSPTALRRAIERLRSDSDADVSLAALASDAGLSRFHFCRAFKESTGLSPHAWLRQHRLEQAMNMLRDPDDIGRVGGGGAWLCLANRVCGGVQEADRRNPERLAQARALAAIARQVRQSLWGRHSSGSLDTTVPTQITEGDKQWPGRTSSAHLRSHRDGERSRPRSCTDFH